MASALESLPEVQTLSPLVMRVLGGNPGKAGGTNTYIIGNGHERVLIDTATISAVEGSPHASSWGSYGGVKQIRDAFPDVTVHKFDPIAGQLRMLDNEMFRVPGATLQIFSTPGHTEDHAVVLLKEEDTPFTGDNILGHGTAVFENLEVYMRSLENMSTLFCGGAYPGHGPVIADGKAKVLEYIRHRQQMEEQVLQILTSGPPSAERPHNGWTVLDLVLVIYKEVPETLHLPSSGGIRHIMAKLDRQGKVVTNELGEEWTATNRPAL